MAKIKKDQLPIFVTLTYPAAWPENAREWKRHLKNWQERLTYKYPGACGVWRLEYQKRGAPHFHLLIWGVSYLDLLVFTARAWYAVVKSGDQKHLQAGTRVEKLRTWRGVMGYASKYLGKTGDIQDIDAGRYWGVFARARVPWAEVWEARITDRQAFTLMRYLRRYGRIPARMYYSLTCFVENPARWLQVALKC